MNRITNLYERRMKIGGSNEGTAELEAALLLEKERGDKAEKDLVSERGKFLTLEIRIDELLGQ